MFPMLTFPVELPEALDAELSDRQYKRLVKESQREVLANHHAKRIRGHFESSAESKYGHQDRNREYEQSKARRFGSVVDNVKTGRTKRMVTGGYKFGGGSQQGGITTSLVMRRPGPKTSRFKRKRGRRAVAFKQQNREIAAVTQAEADEMSVELAQVFARKLTEYMQSRRRRRRRNS